MNGDGCLTCLPMVRSRKTSADKVIGLIYHNFCEHKEALGHKYSFTREEFNAHLDLIADTDLRILTAGDVPQAVCCDFEDRRVLMITFDDGHISAYDIALPGLINLGMKGTFFITTDWIGLANYMGKGHLKELVDERMSIQSHGKTHKFLDKMSEAEVYDELYVSKCTLEDLVGKEVSCVSIPGGRCNDTVKRCAEKIGYRAIYTSMPFQLEYASMPWLVGRLGMRRPLNLSTFHGMLAPSSSFVLKVRITVQAKRVLRFLIGGKLYYRLWWRFVGKH